MKEADVAAEVWRALRTDVTRMGDSCFVSNLAMPELRRYGALLPPAIESVLSDPGFDRARQSEGLVERNLAHLMLVYFGQADEYRWDSARFLKALRGPVLHEALIAVFHLWSHTQSALWRPAMPRRLYDTWRALIAQEPDWIGDSGRMSGLVAAGKLSLVEEQEI
jgi:hypothetical protein